MSTPLGIDDQLNLEIGRVARAHVQVDVSLRYAYQNLVGPSAAILLIADIASTKRLIDDCRLMLTRSGMVSDDVLLSAALATLDAAVLANNERNRVVHDMWMPVFTDMDAHPERWGMYRRIRGWPGLHAAGEPKDLTYVRSVHTQLRRVHHRVNALNFALWDVHPFFRSDRPDDERDLLPERIAIMLDRFELTEDGAARVLP